MVCHVNIDEASDIDMTYKVNWHKILTTCYVVTMKDFYS